MGWLDGVTGWVAERAPNSWMPRALDSKIVSDGEIRGDEHKVAQFRGEVADDLSHIRAARSQVEAAVKRSGMSPEQAHQLLDNFSRLERQAEHNVDRANAAFDRAREAYNNLSSTMREGLSKRESEVLNVLLDFNPGALPNDPALRAQIQELQRSNPRLYQRWQEFHTRKSQLAAAVLAANAEIRSMELNVSGLGLRADAAREISQLQKNLNKWVSEYNDDMDDLRTWQKELSEDLRDMAGVLMSQASDARAEARRHDAEAARQSSQAAGARGRAESAEERARQLNERASHTGK